MRPILEELPKWDILSEIMDEVEVEMHNAPHPEGKVICCWVRSGFKILYADDVGVALTIPVQLQL